MDAFAVFVEHIIIYKHARAVIDASHIFVQIVASLALDTDVLAVTDHAVWNVVLAHCYREGRKIRIAKFDQITGFKIIYFFNKETAWSPSYLAGRARPKPRGQTMARFLNVE